ncbi:receptor-transporting protein 4 [Equus przewalskii]|uniref:Receptor-transporting protein 4 n=1 Tax=Equus przewalskii TaxID=9798 RepID=A0ABM4LDU9_EQUPR|nr:PREDICTED: receptor-transporting protein 4 [Equus przewalskii]
MDSQPQRERVVFDVRAWEKTFQELIQQVKPQAKWTLKLDGNLQADCVAEGWKQYQQRAFGGFWCSSCQRKWYSAKVQILCHMRLEHQKSPGQVLMRLFGQRCRKCSWSRFEKPEFSEDSTMRILNNLVQRIIERFYTNGLKKAREIPVKPEVTLEGSHDSINCEACSLGICGWGLPICMTQPSEGPLSYMEIGSSSPRVVDMDGPNRARNQSSEAKKSQGNGYSCADKRSGPSHSTARILVPGASPQSKWEIGQQPTPVADQQTTQGTGPQPFQVAGSLPQGWTDPQPIQAVLQLPIGRADSQSTLRTEPQAPRRTYSEAVRRTGQQSTQEACSQAIRGAGLQATRKRGLQPTQATIPRATSGLDTQATERASPPSLGSNPQTTRGEIPKATLALDTQATERAGPPPLGSNPQTTQGEIPKAISALDTQATERAGPPSLGSNPQTTQGAIPKAISALETQATERAGPPPLGSNPQPTQGTGPMATRRSGTFSGTQVAWGSQERCLPRRPSDSFSRFFHLMPQNDLIDQNLLFGLGSACVIALFTFLVDKYFK